MTTRTDPGARDPSPPIYKLLRAGMAGLIATAVTWLVSHGILGEADRGVVEEAAVIVLMGAIMAFGSYARDRGWSIGAFLSVPLAFVLGGSLACASLPKPPAEAYAATLGTYRALAGGFAAYCMSPEAEPDPCVRAAQATLQADRAIDALEGLIRSGEATDSAYSAAEVQLRDAMPSLMEVQP